MGAPLGVGERERYHSLQVPNEICCSILLDIFGRGIDRGGEWTYSVDRGGSWQEAGLYPRHLNLPRIE